MSNQAVFLPAPRVSPAVQGQLDDLTECRLLSPAREAGYELHLVGATVWPQRQMITKTSQGTWLFVEHWNDPTADRDGDILVPPEQHEQLVELDRFVAADLLFLGHQLPGSYNEGDPIPQLVPPPKHLREKDERLTQALRTATTLFLKGAGAVLTVAAAAPIVAVGAVASLGAGLDPIIFAGVQHPEEPVVQWVVLVSWVWE
jgi:hypothetical protein